MLSQGSNFFLKIIIFNHIKTELHYPIFGTAIEIPVKQRRSNHGYLTGPSYEWEILTSVLFLG